MELGKVCKKEVKSGKMVKSLEILCFKASAKKVKFFSRGHLILFNIARGQDIRYKYEKFQNSEPYVHIAPWVLCDCLASWKKDWFLRFSMSLLITYLITLSLEKEIIVLEKRLEKVFGSKNLYEHCT